MVGVQIVTYKSLLLCAAHISVCKLHQKAVLGALIPGTQSKAGDDQLQLQCQTINSKHLHCQTCCSNEASKEKQAAQPSWPELAQLWAVGNRLRNSLPSTCSVTLMQSPTYLPTYLLLANLQCTLPINNAEIHKYSTAPIWYSSHYTPLSESLQ
jgi:hypothetical protein